MLVGLFGKLVFCGKDNPQNLQTLARFLILSAQLGQSRDNRGQTTVS